MGLIARLKDFQYGPNRKIKAEPIVHRPAYLSGSYAKKQKIRIINLLDEADGLERELHEIGPEPANRELQKRQDVLINRLVRIKHEVEIRTKLLED
jgi:hypothetical protein